MIIPLELRPAYDNYKYDTFRRKQWLQGLCLECDIPAYPHSRCDFHRKYQMRISYKGKEKRKAEGRCYNCGRELMEFFGAKQNKLCPVCIANLDLHKKG